MNLLVFFAIPLATILLAIVLESILDRPILVGITFFAVYLLIAFTLVALGTISNLGEALVAVIIYSIIAFITAYLTKLIRYILNRIINNSDDGNNSCSANNDNLLTVSCRCNNGDSQNLLTINSNCGEANNENGSGCQGNNSNNISLVRKYSS